MTATSTVRVGDHFPITHPDGQTYLARIMAVLDRDPVFGDLIVRAYLSATGEFFRATVDPATVVSHTTGHAYGCRAYVTVDESDCDCFGGEE